MGIKYTDKIRYFVFLPDLVFRINLRSIFDDLKLLDKPSRP
jgi:hypothetical protein